MNQPIIVGIYKITSPSNRIYIGQSNDIYKRWQGYERYGCKHQILLHNSIKKYGWNKHKKEMFFCNKNELNKLEKYYVDLFQTFNSKYGLNLKDGGLYSKLSEETKKKMSISQTGKKIPIEVREKLSKIHTGKKFSEETRKKISIANSGKNHWTFGKKMTQEHKDKSRNNQNKNHIIIKNKIYKRPENIRKKISLGNKGKLLSEETKRKISVAKFKNATRLYGEANPNSKIVINILNGIFYYSIKEAFESYGTNSLQNLHHKLNEHRKNNTPFRFA